MRIVIADDQRIIREGLATIVESIEGMEVVGLAANGAEAISLVEQHHPDAVLMDLRMPELDGAAATRAIRANHPQTQVVVLTTYADDESVLAALSAGAIGYLTKDASRDDIRRALEAAHAGQGVLDHAVQARLIQSARPRKPTAAELPDGLTEREGQILILIAEGLSNSEIADQLYVSGATVKTHINRIFQKTQSRDRAQATTYAHRHGLVP
ncbi:MAG TPA: response regulator transcription factor [Acidimicrobiales bacterium]|jgi:DNA-binding NarL/FixJ family response regulator